MLSNNVTNMSNAQKFAISINLLLSFAIQIDLYQSMDPLLLASLLSGLFRLLASLLSGLFRPNSICKS